MSELQDRLLNTREIGERIRLNAADVITLIKRGEIRGMARPAVRRGPGRSRSHYFARASEVERYEQRHAVGEKPRRQSRRGTLTASDVTAFV